MRHLINKLRPMYSYLGIEITDQWVKAAEISMNRKKISSVTAYGNHALPNDAVVEGKINDKQHVVHALKQVVETSKFHTKKVHFVLPSQWVMVRFLKLPDVPLKDMRKLVDFEIRNNIHVPFDKPYYDFLKMQRPQALDADKSAEQSLAAKEAAPALQAAVPEASEGPAFQAEQPALAQEPPKLTLLTMKQPLTMQTPVVADAVESKVDEQVLAASAEKQPPKLCDVMLVVSSLDLIEEYVSMLAAAGLQPQSIEFKALSLYRLVEQSHHFSSHGTYVVADLNDETADLSLFHEGQLKITRSVPVAMGVNFEQAGGELNHELERLMNFFRYTLNKRDHEFSHIIVSGDIERLDDAVLLLADRFPQQEVVRLRSDRIMLRVPNTTDTLFATYAVPIGLALRGKQK